MTKSHKLFQQADPEGEYRFFQLAWIVDDLAEAAHKWTQVYGVGPWHVMPKGKMTGTYRGEPWEAEMQIALAQEGPVQFELIQQFCDTPSIYREIFSDDRDKGFHHMCTFSKDMNQTRRHYEDLGYDLIAEIHGSMGAIVYFDTTRDFGLVTEVIEHSPEYVEALGSIAITCANWTGKTDAMIPWGVQDN